MLIRNTIWNLLGEGMPMAAALVSIPFLVGGIGMERFGALTLVWALLGYLMVLDFGLARSLVQIVAERRSQGRKDVIAPLVRSALLLMAAQGIVMGGAIVGLSEPIAEHLVGGSSGLVAEIRNGLLVLAAFVPVALVSAGLRGVLEAHHEFRRINQIKIAVGTINYLSPLVVLPFTGSLVVVITAIAAGRFLGALAYGRLCLKVMPDLLHSNGPRPSLRSLFAMGAWAMVNNVLGPLMTYADRFVLASLVPVAAIAYYTTPFEMVSRLLFIPSALSGVLFPVSAGLFRGRSGELRRIAGLGGFATASVFLAVQLAVALFGALLLRIWLGPEFAANSTPILSFLALGIFFNAVAYVPYTMLHGAGRMDTTAWLQMFEAPVYFVVLWMSVKAWGTAGAAAAWGMRTGCDLLLLLGLMARVLPSTAAVARELAFLAVSVGMAGALGLWTQHSGGSAVVLVAGLTACLGVALWRLDVLRSAVPPGRELRALSALSQKSSEHDYG